MQYLDDLYWISYVVGWTYEIIGPYSLDDAQKIVDAYKQTMPDVVFNIYPNRPLPPAPPAFLEFIETLDIP